MKKVNRAQMQVVSSQFTVYRKTDNREPTTVNRKAFGFSLIELVIVMTIIAILVGAISVSWAKAQEKARDNRRKNDLKGVQQALDFFYETTGYYPQDNGSGQVKCDGTYYNSKTINWGSTFTCTKTSSSELDTFLQQLPKDPINTTSYYYARQDVFHYTLSALLENTKDLDKVDNCDGTGRNYCITNP